MIYFMQAVGGGPIQIGFTSDPERRRRELEGLYRLPLLVLATLPGGLEAKHQIHGRFAHLRVDGSEQFRPDPELMEFISKPLLADMNPASSEPMDPRVVGVVVRGSDEWRDWVNELAGHARLSVADLIDHAMVEYARRNEFKKTAPKR